MNPNDPRNPQNNQYGPPGYGVGSPQQQQWAPQQYPPNPYPYYPPPALSYDMPQNDSEATTIFVLGIVGITACGICAPIAWAKGSGYRRTCLVMGVRPSGLATAGWIMGIIGTVLIGLSILFMIIAAALG